jgi:hypothetical protein
VVHQVDRDALTPKGSDNTAQGSEPWVGKRGAWSLTPKGSDNTAQGSEPWVGGRTVTPNPEGVAQRRSGTRPMGR